MARLPGLVLLRLTFSINDIQLTAYYILFLFLFRALDKDRVAESYKRSKAHRALMLKLKQAQKYTDDVSNCGTAAD